MFFQTPGIDRGPTNPSGIMPWIIDPENLPGETPIKEPGENIREETPKKDGPPLPIRPDIIH